MGAIFVSSGYEPNSAHEPVEETCIIVPQSGSSKSSTPRTPRRGVRANLPPKAPKSVGKAIRDMPKPASDEADYDVDIPEQGLSLTQHNHQFNVLVGVDPVQVEEIAQERQTMLAAEVYRVSRGM